MTKLITVFGSTGAQGGAVIRSLLSNGNFKVRALTRDTESETSKKLKEQNVDVVKCDYSDSKESIKLALAGSDGVFLVTNFGKENEIASKIADAALESGVKHFVFSGLAPANKISNGRYNVPHFDLKYQGEEYIRSLSKSNPSFVSSFVYAPFYIQNFNTFFKPRKNEDGSSYSISIPIDPSSKFPLDLGDIDDIGPIVTGIFSDASKYSGAIVPFSGSQLTGHQIAEHFSKATGKQVNFNFIPPSVFATFGPHMGEMAEMFSYYNEFGSFHDLDKSIATNLTNLTTLDQWLNKVQYKIE